jgi:hypothetical protein
MAFKGHNRRRRTMQGNGLLALSVVGLAAACSGISANSDYDQTYDFSTLHNYAWAEIAGDTLQVDQITLRRIQGDTDQA